MDKRKLFINFSNHPSCYWGDAQRAAAEKYGEICDLPFPVVDEQSSEEEVSQLADRYVATIMSMGEPDEITVHIMGEMTFTFMVVTRLKEMGIRCVASTTERKTSYRDDGTKLSEFSFVRFREY
jgi:hypothetical protein